MGVILVYVLIEFLPYPCMADQRNMCSYSMVKVNSSIPRSNRKHHRFNNSIKCDNTIGFMPQYTPYKYQHVWQKLIILDHSSIVSQ